MLETDLHFDIKSDNVLQIRFHNNRSSRYVRERYTMKWYNQQIADVAETPETDLD